MKKRLLLSSFFSALLVSSAHAQTYNLQVGEASVLVEFPDNDQIRVRPFGAVAGNTGGIKLYELTANGGNYVGFRAPNILGSDNLYTLPNGYGTAGYFLRTDGAGGLTWNGGSDLFTAGTGLSWSSTTLNSVWTTNGTHIHNNNSDNVGIGTTAPAQKLHVTGAGRFSSLAGTGDRLVVANATGDLVATSPAINTAAMVDGAGAATRVAYWSDANTLTSTGQFLYAGENLSVYDAEGSVGEVRLGAAWNRPGVYSSQELQLFSDATGIIFGDSDVERMRLTAAGNLGIGTTSPSFKLHVPSGYIGTDYINTSDNSVASGVTGIMIKAGDNYLRTGTAAAVTAFLNTNNGFIQNQFASAQTGNHWVSGNGRVGGEFYYSGWLRKMGGGSTGLYWGEGTGAAWHIYPASQADMRFRTGSGNGGIVGTIGDETARGYIHWTTSNEIGFLNASRNWSLRVDNAGNSFHTASSRAPIFYDLNDTGYYLDPNSTSDAAGRYRGGVLHGPNPTWGAYLMVGGDGRQNYTNSATASVAVTNGNLHMDAGSGYDMYLNYYDGNTIHFGRGNNSIRATLDGNGLYLYDGWLRPHGDNGLYFQDGGTGLTRVQADGGQYGSVSTYGSIGGWEGYSIDGRFVFMGQDNGQEWGIYNDVDNIWSILYNRLATDNGFRFFNSWSGNINMRIQHTNGGNYASYDGDNNWDFYSDRRLKKNIENEENILDRVLKLDVVNYDFIETEPTEAEKEKGFGTPRRKDKEIGFIAQEVEKYFPSIVSEAEDDRYDFKVKALGYSSFGILAVGAIKELKIEKDQDMAGLNKMIAEQNQKIERLERLVEQLLKGDNK